MEKKHNFSATIISPSWKYNRLLPCKFDEKDVISSKRAKSLRYSVILFSKIGKKYHFMRDNIVSICGGRGSWAFAAPFVIKITIDYRQKNSKKCSILYTRIEKKMDFRGSARGRRGGGVEHLWQLLGSKSQFIIEMDVFSTKYGHESIGFFREWTFFDKIWVWEQWFFHEKWKKKGIPLTFLAHNPYNVVLTELIFFDEIWAWQQGVFH